MLDLLRFQRGGSIKFRQGQHHRGQGGKSPPKDFKKGENEKNMMYFQASKSLKLAFLSSLTRKYVLWKGFYHDFSTKKASASGGFAPWPPPRGSAPWTPEVPSPPKDLPWRLPWIQASTLDLSYSTRKIKCKFMNLIHTRQKNKNICSSCLWKIMNKMALRCH